MARRSPGEDEEAGVGDGKGLGLEGDDAPAGRLAAASGYGDMLAAASEDGRILDETLPGSDERAGEVAFAPGAGLGRYRVVRRIGEGGMGVVYAARDGELDRDVALKVLRRAGRVGNEARRARLVREAQAMAKLSHPNLVPVFEAGELGGELFVAMELVGGEDLAAWMRSPSEPRGQRWREVVKMFLQAARGLDAAHRAGVVHRDFKPSNVRVGSDGRARVLDFGLARSAADTVEEARGGDEPDIADGRGGALTEAGAVIGTLAYLAPAQLRGEVADAASDQYAFAVSLRQALTGALPFSEEDLAARRSERRISPWPAGPWPRALRRGVDRAMAARASERFASMRELIAALERCLGATRRQAMTAAAAVAVVAVAGAASGVTRWTAEAPAPPRCDGGGELLAGAWDAQIAEQLEETFTASGAAEASKAAMAVRGALDGYASRWRERRREICRATLVRGEQTERVMQLRFSCLERRRDELGALTQLFLSGDRTVIARSLAATGELPALEACDDVAALSGAPTLPTDATARQQIGEAQRQVDHAMAQRRAGQYLEGLEQIGDVMARAERLGYAPLTAAALFAGAELENWGGDAVKSEELYRRAARLYAELGDDDGLAKAWVALVFVVGSLQGKPSEGEQLGELASSLAVRRKDPVIVAQLEHHLGAVAYGGGKLDEAAAHFERALALRREVLGPRHLSVANTLATLGAVRKSQERYDEAQALGEEALELKTQLLGAEHPEVAVSYRNLAALAIARRQLPLARQLEERAMEIHKRASGEVHFEVANSLNNLGQTYMEEKDYATAVSYQQRALQMYRDSLPAGHPLIGSAAFSLADSLAELRRFKESLGFAEEGLKILDEVGGNPVDRAHAAYQVALALGALKQEPARARKLMIEARDAYREIDAEKWQGMADGWLVAHGGAAK